MDDPNTRKRGEKDLNRGCEKKSRNSHVVSALNRNEAFQFFMESLLKSLKSCLKCLVFN